MEDKKYETDYEKGYNSGYTIAKYTPDLADKLAKTEMNVAYIEGFIDGQDMYELDRQYLDKPVSSDKDLPYWLQSDRLTQDFNEAGKDKDKDAELDTKNDKDQEPEI